MKPGRGNAGSVETVENQTQVFHASHRPLKIPQTRRDFHISTAINDDSLSYQKNQRKEVGRSAASSFSYRLSLRSSGPIFMLIVQLENAPADRSFQAPVPT